MYKVFQLLLTPILLLSPTTLLANQSHLTIPDCQHMAACTKMINSNSTYANEIKSVTIECNIVECGLQEFYELESALISATNLHTLNLADGWAVDHHINPKAPGILLGNQKYLLSLNVGSTQYSNPSSLFVVADYPNLSSLNLGPMANNPGMTVFLDNFTDDALPQLQLLIIESITPNSTSHSGNQIVCDIPLYKRILHANNINLMYNDKILTPSERKAFLTLYFTPIP